MKEVGASWRVHPMPGGVDEIQSVIVQNPASVVA